MDTLQTALPRRNRFQIITLEERIAPSLLDVDVEVEDVTVQDNLNKNNINVISVGTVRQTQ